MPGHVRRDEFGERLVVQREILEHQKKRNHTVICIEILTEVIMPAQLTREESVLLAHAILHERMAPLRYDRPAALASHSVQRGPDHAWIEDDRVVAAILRQQDVGEQRNDVRA